MAITEYYGENCLKLRSQIIESLTLQSARVDSLDRMRTRFAFKVAEAITFNQIGSISHFELDVLLFECFILYSKLNTEDFLIFSRDEKIIKISVALSSVESLPSRSRAKLGDDGIRRKLEYRLDSASPLSNAAKGSSNGSTYFYNWINGGPAVNASVSNLFERGGLI